jgi:hypothetical protein
VKRIAAFLLLLNIGLLMWGTWYKDSTVPEPATPQPPIAESQMLLLTEPGAKPIRRRASQPEKQLKAVEHVCYAVGPFGSARAAAAGGTHLRKLGLVYRLRSKETESKIYRVYIPPMGSRNEALVMQRKLRKLGFKDNAILRERAMNNAISVGVYAKHVNANRILRDLKKNGILARIQVIDKLTTQNWLDIDTAEVAIETLQAVPWEKGVSVEQVPCTPSGSR